MTRDQLGSGYTDCPACGYKKALAITERDGKQLFHCFAGCDQTDLLAAIRGRNPGPVSPRTEAPRQVNRGTQDYIQQLWRSSLAAQGTLGAIYLASRGLSGPIPSALRVLPDHPHKPTSTRWSVMLAAVTDIHGRLQAIHRTFLASDGTGKAPVAPAKMTLGVVGGHAVHLAPAGETLALAEGIETALSVMQSTGIPTWSTISAGGMRQLILPPLPLASEVVIAADADPVGMQAAHDAAARFVREGRRARIASPPAGTDFNDVLREAVA